MTPREDKTREQVLQEAINTDAGVVRLDALVAYLESRREDCREAVRVAGQEQRVCDSIRGKHHLLTDLLTILKTENP